MEENTIAETKNNVSKDFISWQESLQNISPSCCRPWKYSDRIASDLGDINELANSIKKNGQQEPILVRPVESSEKNIKFEVIFGERRWRACALIGYPLKCIVKLLTDQEAAIAQKEENENRKNISEYSKALTFQQLLKAGIFSSITELASAMNMSKQSVSDLLAFTRINPKILAAMPEPHKLSKKSAVCLAALSAKNDEAIIEKLVKISTQINYGKISANKIKAFIKGKITEIKTDQSVFSKILKDAKGKNLIDYKRTFDNSISIKLDQTISEKIPDSAIVNFLKNYLKDII